MPVSLQTVSPLSGKQIHPQRFECRFTDGKRAEMLRFQGDQSSLAIPQIRIHGLQGGPSNFRGVLHNTPREDNFSIALPGSNGYQDGERDGISFGTLAVSYIPAMVEAVRQVTGKGEVHALGHSMGGNVLMAMLAARSDMRGVVTRLAVLSSPVDFSNMIPSFKILSWTLDPCLELGSRAIHPQRIDAMAYLVQKGLFYLFQHSEVLQHAVGKRLLWDPLEGLRHVKVLLDQEGIRPVPLSILREYAYMVREGRFKLLNGLDVLAGLSDYRHPVLVASSHHDETVPYQTSQPFLNLVGTAEAERYFVELSHVGHVQLLTHRSLWRKAIRPFFAGELNGQNHLRF